MAGLELAVLGPLRVVAAGEPIPIARPAQRRLLAILLHAGGARIARDVLIDQFWAGEPPPSARAALQMHIAALRRLVPCDLIVTEAQGYSLLLGEHEFDVCRFDKLAASVEAAARQRAWDTVVGAAADALDLWRGAPFDELRHDEFALPERVRLSEIRHLLVERRAEGFLASGDPELALPDLEAAVADEPLRERRWALLARARQAVGRHTDALRAIQDARVALVEVGLEPGSALQIVEQELLHAPVLSVPLTPRRRVIAEPLTSFVGRSTEFGGVVEALERHRLVTLTGTGGAGKTRLAFEVTRTLSAAWADGCTVVELAAARRGASVLELVVAAMGLEHAADPASALRVGIGDAQVLLLLDNCEHLVAEVAAAVAVLMRVAPSARILATSRVPLWVPGECVIELGPFAVPAEDDPVDDIKRSDAVQLFIDRARLVHSRLVVRDGELQLIAEVCRRLDGLPLAIELAAARVRTLGLATIAARLDQRLDLLGDGSLALAERHRGLRAAIEWSHGLLSAEERRLFARLSMFQGSFELDGVAALCGAAPEDHVVGDHVVAALAALVDQSLVATADEAGGRRYRLLETIREFAADQLLASGECDAVRDRHMHWYANCADHLRERWHVESVATTREAIESGSDDMLAALEHARAIGDRSAASSLAACLGWLAAHRGQVTRAVVLLEEGLVAAQSTLAEADLRAMLAAELFAADDVVGAEREAAAALELVVDAPDSSPVVSVVMMRAANLDLLLVDHDSSAALPLARQAVDAAERVGHPAVRFRAWSFLAFALAWNGLAAESTDARRRAQSCAVASGDDGLATTALVQGLIAVHVAGDQRRTGARAIIDELSALGADEAAMVAGGDWVVFSLLQLGDIERADSMLDRRERQHLEGYDRCGQLVMRATVRWMQQRFDDAADVIDAMERRGVISRWHHDFYPMAAAVAAERGRRDEVRRLAETYLAAPVDRSEEIFKLAVLWPLARAEVDAALDAAADADSHRHADAERAARHAVTRARAMFCEHDAAASAGSVQLEVPRTYLALAEAELARLDGTAVEAWRSAALLPDYAAIRAYAERRLDEALAAVTGEAAR